MVKEFVDFLKLYGVIGLAIAVIIGGKLNLLVTSVAAGVENIALLSFNGIMYGKVVAALIDFIVVAFIVFLFAKKVMKEEMVTKK